MRVIFVLAPLILAAGCASRPAGRVGIADRAVLPRPESSTAERRHWPSTENAIEVQAVKPEVRRLPPVEDEPEPQRVEPRDESNGEQGATGPMMYALEPHLLPLGIVAEPLSAR